MSEAQFARRRSPALTVLGVVAVLVVGGLGTRWWFRRQAEQAWQAQAQQQFAPVKEKLQAAARAPAGTRAPAYDIDETVKVIHEIDLAVQQSGSMGDYLQQMARRDYTGVAPEVLASREKLMDVLFRIYAKQSEQQDQVQMWSLTSQLLLGTLSVVGGEAKLGALGPTGSITVDKEQARALLQDLEQSQGAKLRLGREERALEGELLDDLVAYAKVYDKYVKEWDRLCTVRDRAYLAAHNGDWSTAQAAAAEAVRMAPTEREAHLLDALAMIEGGQADGPEGAAQVEVLLTDYIDQHPDSTAPAFLLLGVEQARRGNLEQATLNLQQSAAYYPKQADALSDMLDPYKMRSYLRKTREGSYVIELYKSTMLGAGYFSPDLQLARLAFDRGQFEDGRTKVMDHFSRRRSQEQWDFLLSDIEFCQSLLGPDFRRIFPEDHYLDLVVKPTVFGSKLDVSVDNRSDRPLHNASLVLALHFTDMHADDYQTFVAGDTQPAVPAHEVTSFGDVGVGMTLNGKEKSVDDIVTDRAILVADEAVLWVDTDAYKIAEAKEFRQGRVPSAAAEAEARGEVAVGGGVRTGLLDRIVSDAHRGTLLQVDEKKLLKDGITITLPKELAVLRPLFQLKYGDQVFGADENVILDDHIQLRFDSVDDFSDPDRQLALTASTVLGDMTWTWDPQGGSQFRLSNVQGNPDLVAGRP